MVTLHRARLTLRNVRKQAKQRAHLQALKYEARSRFINQRWQNQENNSLHTAPELPSNESCQSQEGLESTSTADACVQHTCENVSAPCISRSLRLSSWPKGRTITATSTYSATAIFVLFEADETTIKKASENSLNKPS